MNNAMTVMDLGQTYQTTEKKLQQMLQLLEVEHDLLKEQDLEKLALLSTHKQNLSNELDSLSTMLTNQLDRLGFPENSSDTSANFVQRLGNDELTTLLKSNRELSKACQQLNNKNGAIISILSRQNQRTLNVLLGNEYSGPSMTYGPDGSSTDTINSLRIESSA